MDLRLHRMRPVLVGADTQIERCVRCEARHQSVCSVVEDAELSQLENIATSVEFTRGQTFIREGEPAKDFFNIKSGTAKLYKLLPDGRQQITGFATTGYFLGLAVSQTFAFSAEAIEPIQACRFSKQKLYQLLEDVPALEHRLLETACNELATAQEQILLLGRKTAKERVASFLLSCLKVSTPCGQSNHIRLPMTRSEIADYLGLTVETVSRTLTRFVSIRRVPRLAFLSSRAARHAACCSGVEGAAQFQGKSWSRREAG